MEEAVHSPRFVRFGIFEVDLPAGELRKGGLKLKLTGQPFQVLAILLERPGEVVTREELQKRLWPDTFVDVDHNLNTAINKIREVLDDSAESPRFVETLPRRGYRFVAPVNGAAALRAPEGAERSANEVGSGTKRGIGSRAWLVRSSIAFAVAVLLGVAAFVIQRKPASPAPVSQRALTRLTFDDGLQIGATWSPDGRFIAYSSDRGGKFDIWVQQASGGNPVQVTHSQANNWQPDWSPDGQYITYRSEDGEGGLFVIPALGGAGLERKVAAFGFYPRWSPDGSQILFQTDLSDVGRLYVVSLDGSQPHEVLTEFLTKHPFLVRSAAWHPDGIRVSVRVWDDAPVPVFWTVPVAGGEGIRSEIDPQVLGHLGEVSLGRGKPETQLDRKFSWAPSGGAIYFDRTFRGARNLWKISIDPETLRAVAIERLTTGPGLDSELALSPDGKRLAFTGESENVRAWLFPFDSVRGRLTGTGRAVTSSGIEAWFPTLTRDGKKLAFCALRAGRPELWEKSLADGRETLVVPDDYRRSLPQWSPDGTRLAYRRGRSWAAGESQLFVWSADTRREEPVSAPSTLNRVAYDWSPDGRGLLVSQEASDTHSFEIWLRPATVVTGAEPAARRIISDPGYDLWQAHFSPNGQWIVFEATRSTPTVFESRLYVMQASGGPKIPINDGKYFDDKPRWSPDGRTIYFVSGRGGFFNVWGIRFDSVKGKPVGEPFRVTAFTNPGLMIPNEISPVGFSLSQDSLVLNLAQVSGSIWVLDNVGP